MADHRAYWKGYLKLSLVTCPVALYPASSQAEKTRFHQINRKTGNRLREQMVDVETGRVVDKENKGRGYDGESLFAALAVRNDVIGPLIVALVDVLLRHELVDVDRVRALDLDGL